MYIQWRVDKILTDIYDGDGYAFVNMYKDGERYPKKNQHLVAENFPELVENDILHQLWRKFIVSSTIKMERNGVIM